MVSIDVVPVPEVPQVPVVSESPLAHGVSAESVVPIVVVSVPVLMSHVSVPVVAVVSVPVLVPQLPLVVSVPVP